MILVVGVFKIGVTLNVNDIDVTWDAFNASLALLELYIVIFTIAIGIFGFIGYYNIKESVKEQTINKLLDDLSDENTSIGRKFMDTIRNNKNNTKASHSIDVGE